MGYYDQIPTCLHPCSLLLSTGVAILQQHRMAKSFWSEADLDCNSGK